MRILLDHCVPKPFRRKFPTHYGKTAAQMGWADLRNGKLLAEAGLKFDVFLTIDKNIKHQQNLNRLPIPVISLDAIRNTPEGVRPFAPLAEIELGK